MTDTTTKPTARLYRMVMPKHVCPYGLKSKALLERRGFRVEDHPLKTRTETDAFKAEHGVDTTPQTFIEGERIGGYDALREYFGIAPDPDKKTYTPVLMLFAMAAAMAIAISWLRFGTVEPSRWLVNFIAVSMCLLAVQKLRDIESFSTMFLNYDLLARRWVGYGYVYPFAEGLAGVLMLAGALSFVSGPIAAIIGGIGAVSVIKAVYIDGRDLKCACMGGESRVPLGFISWLRDLTGRGAVHLRHRAGFPRR